MMLKNIYIDERKIRVSDTGEGTTLVFLHGYLESLEIWDSFLKYFEEEFRVIAIDIPGHGESDVFSGIHTMELMADTINLVLENLGIDKCFMFGHSMGGYITMAFYELYWDKLLGFSLFHSTPFADNEEKREARDREIELVQQGKKRLIIDINIPKAFATDNLEKFKDRLSNAKKIAGNCPDEGIIALLNGMKMRPDRSSLLKEAEIPFLYFLGKKDNYIPFDQIVERINLPSHTKMITLEDSGHMGFIEEAGIAAKSIKDFIEEALL